MVHRPRRVLLIDLNNFARYPTIAVGYLAAILRRAGIDVEVFSPLAHGLPGLPREPRPRPWSVIDQRLRHWSAVSPHPVIRRTRTALAAQRRDRTLGDSTELLDVVEGRLQTGADLVLISTYLMYRGLCARFGQLCEKHRVPLIIGGSYFFQEEVAEAWRDLSGLTALVGGEVEPFLVDLVEAAIAGSDMSAFPGTFLPDGRQGPACLPLGALDDLPFPDYRDFPWDRYPNRIIPVITGRGCGWGVCTFCSDVTSSMGRTFRSRSPANVLDEIEYQRRRHDTNLFVFTDLKLNSNLAVWHGLIEHMQDRAPGGRWIAAIHAGIFRDNGLSGEELRSARKAGLVRLTTGLESGSQRMLDAMSKGTELSETSRFLTDARDAGISVRTTLVVGYPGEEPADVDATAEFLERHSDRIDRVSLNRLQIMTGTRLHRRIERKPAKFPGVVDLTVDHRIATIHHRYETASSRSYGRSMTRLLRAVHRINRRRLAAGARDFEGVM